MRQGIEALRFVLKCYGCSANNAYICSKRLALRKAVFPGSFDPITIGHVEIIKRALPLFEEVVVAVGENSQKKTLFPLEQRMQWLKEVFADEPQIQVDAFEGLTVHFCKKIGANYLVRGLRNSSDFDYEKTISQLNQIVGDNIETLFFISQPAYSHISSTIVREIIKGGGDASPFLPDPISISLHNPKKSI